MGQHRRVIFYQDRKGRAPVKARLAELRRTRPEEYTVLMNKKDLLEDAGYQQAIEVGILKPIEEKLFEIKPKGRQARLIIFPWDHTDGRPYWVAVGLEIKKQDKLDRKVVARAKKRYHDWTSRKN